MMNRKEVRLLWLLAVIVIAASAYWGMSKLAENDRLSAQSAESAASRYSIPDSSSIPAIQMDQLLADKQTTFTAGRNIFVYSSKPVVRNKPVQREITTAEIDEPAEEDLPPLVIDETPAKPQLRGYDYIGFQQASNGLKRAVFRWRGRTFVGMEGMVINNAFKIKELKPKSAVIHVLAGEFEQVLDLNDPSIN
jgi:hypothetical protein